MAEQQLRGDTIDHALWLGDLAFLDFQDSALLWLSHYRFDVPPWPYHGLLFTHPLIPTALLPTLTPSLIVLSLHTSLWTKAFAPKSLPKLQKE